MPLFRVGRRTRLRIRLSSEFAWASLVHRSRKKTTINSDECVVGSFSIRFTFAIVRPMSTFCDTVLKNIRALKNKEMSRVSAIFGVSGRGRRWTKGCTNVEGASSPICRGYLRFEAPYCCRSSNVFYSIFSTSIAFCD